MDAGDRNTYSNRLPSVSDVKKEESWNAAGGEPLERKKSWTPSGAPLNPTPGPSLGPISASDLVWGAKYSLEPDKLRINNNLDDGHKHSAMASSSRGLNPQEEKPEECKSEILQKSGEQVKTERPYKRDREGNLKISSDDHKMEDVKSEAAEDVKMEPEESPEDADKDKDAVVVQQRKRMSRHRVGSQQTAPKEARSSRFRKEREGPFVQYKVGERLPELSKIYAENGSKEGTTLEVRITADLATTSNRQVRGSQLWGTDIYTEDSDLVAVLMHTGYYCPTATPPCITEIRATIRVLPPQTSYTSTLRNSVRSRAWGAATGCSYSIEKCRIVKANNQGIVDLEPCLNRMSAVAPTLAPAAMERTMTTRSASSNAHRQQRFAQEVTIQYNLCNEPWMKYQMSIVADRGLKRSQFTSARLKRGDVLYLETHRRRYELSYDGEKASSNGTVATSSAAQASDRKGLIDKDKDKHNGHCDKNGHSGEYSEHYKWSLCANPLPLATVRSKGVPLPPDCIEVVEDSLEWEEVQWSPTSVWVRGKEYVLARAQFLSPRADVLTL